MKNKEQEKKIFKNSNKEQEENDNREALAMKLANIGEKELTKIEEEEIKVDIEMGVKGASDRSQFEADGVKSNQKVS